MSETMHKIMWGFRESEPLKSVVIHGSGDTSTNFRTLHPSLVLSSFYTQENTGVSVQTYARKC